MIISDRYKLAFVHIPKCGGSTVRHALAAIDDRPGLYDDVGHHEDLKHVDFKHLPLRLLKQNFSRDFQLIREYRAYGLCRDPSERFLSALLQRIMMYGHARRETLSRSEIAAQMDEVITYLSGREAVDDFRFIHFEKQYNFLYADGEQVVDRIYRLADIGRMSEDIAAYTGLEMGFETKRNESLHARNGAVQFAIDKLWPIGQRVLPTSVTNLRHHVKRYIYAPARENLGDIVGSVEVKRFIQSYYSQDIELFHSVGRS